jgi:ferritin-like metal-binding protein YciE
VIAYTAETVRSWHGRAAVDADGHELGAVVADVWPDWLAIERSGGTGEIVLAPLAGAEPTGQAIRLAVLGDTVLQAPPVADPAAPDQAERTRLAAHYARPVAPAPASPAAPPPGRVDGTRRRSIVARLRAADALEGEGLRRLHALPAAVGDPEVQHDATLHAGVTELHRTGIERRLAALEAGPSKARDALRAIRATLAGARGRTGLSGSAALRDAEAFERREAAFYEELETLARAAGDTATADLAAAHRADELAAADTLAGSVPRLESPA